MNNRADIQYGVQLLDDLHRYFPAFLYDTARFSDVRDIFAYIRDQMNYHFNTYDRARVQYRQENPIPTTNRTYFTNARMPPVQTNVRQQMASTSDITRLLSLLVSPTMSELTTLQALFGGGQPQTMEPVVVAPTEQQINAGTTLMGATSQHESQQCAICQDSFVSGQGIRRINQCSHEFHRGCIDVWFQRNVRCPVCRYDIRGESTGSGFTGQS